MTELIPVNQEERFYLVKYERACQALAEASSIDEIKAVHDFSIRMRLYARQSNNRNMAADAIVLQARAEREIGLLMRAQRDTFGLSYASLSGCCRKEAQVPRSTRIPHARRTPLLPNRLDQHEADQLRARLSHMSDRDVRAKLGMTLQLAEDLAARKDLPVEIVQKAKQFLTG